jgi:hypothetical protein
MTQATSPAPAWSRAHTFNSIWKFAKDFTSNTEKRMQRLWSLCESMRKTPGDIVEFGVYAGASALVIANAFELNRPAREQADGSRHFWMIDNYGTGLKRNGPHDRLPAGEFGGTGVRFPYSIEEAVRMKATSELIRVEKRTIIEIDFGRSYELSDIALEMPREFAFVHLDCTYHDDYWYGLDYFWPHVVPGGMLVVEEYGVEYAPGCKIATDSFAKDAGLTFELNEDGEQAVFHKPA